MSDPLKLEPNHEKALQEARGRAAARPERWYRLTAPTGPAAIEACEVVGDKVVKRWQVEEKNVRAVVLARLGDMLDGVEES